MELRTGIVDKPSDHLDHCWYVVGTVDQATLSASGPLRVTLREIDYVIWRASDGSLTATRDRCPHREAPLSEGELKDGCITCAYHGWRFGKEGMCIEIPSARPEIPIPKSAHLAMASIEEHYGLLWLCPGEPRQNVPRLGVDSDQSFTRLNTPIQIWHCSPTRMIDNMLDVSHFPYTHRGTFGRDQEKVVPRFQLTQLDETFYGYEYDVVINNSDGAQIMSGHSDDVISLQMSTGFCLPFSVRSTMTYANGIKQTLFMTASPITQKKSYYTFVLWRNDNVETSGREIVDFELAVTDEDRSMLERLRGELSLDQGHLVDVQSDKASVEWRRRYARLVKEGVF